MKPLQAHFLQLTVDGLDHRPMVADQAGIFLTVAAQIAAILGDQAHAARDVGQQFILSTENRMNGFN